MSDFSEALAWLLSKERGLAARIADTCGIRSGYISELKSGKKDGSEKTRHNIATAIGVSYDNMLALGRHIIEGGDASSWPGVTTINSKRTRIRGGTVIPTEMPPVRLIPLISFIQAGDFVGGGDIVHPEEWVEYLGVVGKRAFALRVQGRSMEPEFFAGEIVIVDPDRHIESCAFVIAQNGDHEATIKEYVRDGERHFLVPRNQDWGKPMDMTDKEWRIIGRVIAKMKHYC